MSWIETLDSWDRQLMLNLNVVEGSPTDDCFWALYSGKWIWLGAVLVIIYTLIWRCRSGWRPALMVLGFTIILVTLTDQISASLIKPMLCRPRPSHTEGLQDLLHYVGNYRGGHYGFVSSHAANSMGMALWLTLLFHGRILACTMFLWAALNCYSRIRLGVHFPGDILGGTVVGLLVAYGLWRGYIAVRRLTFHTSTELIHRDYERTPWAIIGTVWGIMLLILILSLFFTSINPLTNR